MRMLTTKLLKILISVWWLAPEDLKTGLSMAKAWLTLLILFLISRLPSPCVVIILLRKTNSLTSPSCRLFTVTGLLEEVFLHRTGVFLSLALSPGTSSLAEFVFYWRNILKKVLKKADQNSNLVDPLPLQNKANHLNLKVERKPWKT